MGGAVWAWVRAQERVSSCLWGFKRNFKGNFYKKRGLCWLWKKAVLSGKVEQPIFSLPCFGV